MLIEVSPDYQDNMKPSNMRFGFSIILPIDI